MGGLFNKINQKNILTIQSMIEKTSNSIQTTQAPIDYFTGSAWIDRLVKKENISVP